MTGFSNSFTNLSIVRANICLAGGIHATDQSTARIRHRAIDGDPSEMVLDHTRKQPVAETARN